MIRSQHLLLGALALALVPTLLFLATGSDPLSVAAIPTPAAAAAPDVAPASAPGQVLPEEPMAELAPDPEPELQERRRSAEREARLLAAGVVVDRTGRPVANASVFVDAPVEGADLSGRSTWKRVFEIRAVTDGEGRFRLDGELTAEFLALSVMHPRFAPLARVQCDTGEDALRLELQAAGGIAGLLSIDRELSFSSFAVSASVGEPVASTFSGSFLGDGSFTISGLPPGTFTVSIGLADEPETAQHIEQVNVVTGSVTHLAPIDLRGRVRTIWLRVLGATGEPPARASVRRRAPGEPTFPSRVQAISGGRIQLATLRDCLDLQVVAPGHRPELLECVSSETEVRLQTGPAVRLIFEEELSGPDLRLGVSLARHGEVRDPSRGTVLVDDRGMVLATLEGVGLYDVRVYAWQVIEGEVGHLLSNRIEDCIDVRGELGEQSFPLRLADETLAAIESYRKD